jgi:hypothetical protein
VERNQQERNLLVQSLVLQCVYCGQTHRCLAWPFLASRSLRSSLLCWLQFLRHQSRKVASCCRAVVAHTFNPSTWEAEAGGFLSSIESSLVYRVSSRTARVIQRNPVSEKKQNQKTNKQKNLYSLFFWKTQDNNKRQCRVAEKNTLELGISLSLNADWATS